MLKEQLMFVLGGQLFGIFSKFFNLSTFSSHCWMVDGAQTPTPSRLAAWPPTGLAQWKRPEGECRRR